MAVNVIFMGEMGAGKSTLRSNITDGENNEVMLASSVTQENSFKEVERNGVTLKLCDTVGLEDDESKNKEILQQLSKSTDGQADLIVFCVPVRPGSRFLSTPRIMRAVHEAYGGEIWKRCIFAFTFSNVAWDRCMKNAKGDKAKAVDSYKVYMREFADKIEEEMQKMGTSDIVVGLPFSPKQGGNVITAVPVGDETDDEVLPGIKLAEEDEKWKGFFYLQMIENCSKEKQRALLKYRYNSTSAVKEILTAMGLGAATLGTGGAVMGAIAGGLKGAIVGIPGGPAGMVAGAAMGAASSAVAGGLVGTLHGGLTTGAVLSVLTAIRRIVSWD